MYASTTYNAMDIKRLREDTPCRNVYLNHVSTSVPPRQVVEAVSEYYCISTTFGSTSARGQSLTLDRVASARAACAQMIGSAPEEICFTANGSQAISLVAQGLELKAGDNVIVDGLSFIANAAPFLWLKKTKGIEVRFAPVTMPGITDLKGLEAMIDRSTRLISICHMPNNLGMLQPVHEIGHIAKKHSVPYMLDAANTIGMQTLNVSDIGCDFMAASGRKYLRGPSGSGFLYVNSNAAEMLEPLVPTWNSGTWDWREDKWDWDKNLFIPAPGAARMNMGEYDFPAIFGLGRAVEYVEECGGVEKIRQRTEQLLRYLIEKMNRVPGVQILGSMRAEDYGGMVGFNIKDVPFPAVGCHLNDNNVGVMAHSFFSPGVLKLFGVKGVVRFCVHCWNTEDELDYAVSLLSPENIRKTRQQ